MMIQLFNPLFMSNYKRKDDFITRQDLAVMIYRAALKKNIELVGNSNTNQIFINRLENVIRYLKFKVFKNYKFYLILILLTIELLT